MSVAEHEWWRHAFAADYAAVYAHRDDASAAREIEALLPLLRSRGGLVLDAACGNGRHLAAMRAAGLRCVGFDFSADLLALARSRHGLQRRLCRADLRRMPFQREAFAAITVLFTAFGYFDEDENDEVLRHLATLLRRDGLMVIDVPDPEAVRQTLVPRSERRLPDGRLLVEERRLRGDRVEKQLILDDGTRSCRWSESVRLYAPHEWSEMARAAGLAMEDRWSGLDGPQSSARRHVHLLRRKGD